MKILTDIKIVALNGGGFIVKTKSIEVETVDDDRFLKLVSKEQEDQTILDEDPLNLFQGLGSSKDT